MKEVIEKSLIYLDRTNKVYFIVWGLLMGSALTYAVYLESNYTFYKLCYNKLLQTIPHGEFYSTIAEVIATVFGISIPIAIGIVADHLKQYNDRGIANLFRNERIFKNHLFHSLVLLMACIVLEFIDFKQSIWQLFVIIYFIYLVIQFRSFVLLVIEYSSNTDELIFKKTIKDIEKFSKNNSINSDDIILETSFTRLSKLITYSIERDLNDQATDYFKKSFELISMLLQIYYPKYKAQRDIQLEQWKKLSDTFSKKTVELKFIENVDEKADSTNDPTDLNNVYASEQPKEMNYWVNIYSKLLLDVLSKCMVKGNFNLFATCSNSINDLIQNLASLDHQSEHINQLIYVQRSIVKEGLYNLKPHNIWMLNSSAFMWYLDSFGNKSFRTEYINDFNFQLFESIRFVINVKLEDVWKSFIGFSINSSYSHFSFLDIFEFVSHLEPVVYEPLEKEFNELFRKIENVDYHNYRETINSDFEAYFHKVAKNITEANHNKIKIFKNNLLDVIRQRTLYNNLKYQIFIFSTYSIFKNKYNFIEYQLNYNLPPDTNVHWTNKDINPETTAEFFTLLLKKNRIAEIVKFRWEDHHSPEQYIYFNYIVLFANAIIKGKRLPKYGIHTENNDLKSFSPDELKDLKYYCEQLLKYLPTFLQRLSSYNANVIANIVIKSDLENTLNLTLAKIESIIKANHEELLIDKSVLNTFKSDFIKLFSGYTKVRQIFKYLNLINDSYDVNKSLHYIGINVVEPKEYFDPAYISDHIRFNCQDLSQSEDQYLFMKLRSVCENRNMSKSEFISWIISSEINKHFILIGNNSSLYRNIFEDLEGFKPIWDILGINDRKHYRIGTLNEMNIFEINDNLPGATIFCLDRRLLGRLTQFLPTETNESEDFHPPFFFKVEQFASNDSLIEEYMKDPAPWLLEAGNSNAQKSKLKQSVWVRILEKIDIVFEKPGQIGFNIKLTDVYDI